MTLEKYFEKFKHQIIGWNQIINTPYGQKHLIYADWTGSGRLYRPIENKFLKEIYPLVANTHTESTTTGMAMTRAYNEAKVMIKKHVNAGSADVLIPAGSGATGAIILLQYLLGLKLAEKLVRYCRLPSRARPIVFVTHMEHHSNHTTWLETIADVEVIKPNKSGQVDIDNLKKLIKKYHNRKLKIAAVTAASNVTGIASPYHKIAELMHQNGGWCFVDFACAAPYVEINMHPKNKCQNLDAVYFSPHKFLGGPGTTGILIFNSKLYTNRTPNRPGGGTITWTNPWGGRHYFSDIEIREDGGTPPFLQTIRVALVIKLKKEMGIKKMLKRKKEIVDRLLTSLEKIESLEILDGQIKNRLGVISFTIKGAHYNLVVKLLNDRFGIQTRGGCACAGTYGHYLFDINQRVSKIITNRIDQGDLSSKPGFVRLSIHPTMPNKEITQIIEALKQIVKNHKKWVRDYKYNRQTNEFIYRLPLENKLRLT